MKCIVLYTQEITSHRASSNSRSLNLSILALNTMMTAHTKQRLKDMLNSLCQKQMTIVSCMFYGLFYDMMPNKTIEL